jgi:hypothetical protein
MLARSPGFTAVVVLILAVGIGANTGIFSVVNAAMLRPLSYKDSHRLVTIWEQGVRTEDGFRGRSHFFFLRENNEVFESLAGYCGRLFYIAGIERPHEAQACEVTSNLFSLLGVPPMLGRGFLPEEERPENAHVVVLSHAFWKEHLGGSPDAVGKSVTLTVGRPDDNLGRVLERESYTIVGVMPAGFSFPFGRPVPFWRPLTVAEGATGLRPVPILPLGRLKKGITPEQADADLAVLAERLRQFDPKVKFEGGKFGVQRLLEGLVEGHIGIRMALGARRIDILRAVLGRGLRLTLIGVVIGLAGAVALTRVLSSFLYDVTPTDPLTLACVSLVLAGVALLASYIPARRAARIDPMAALRYE